MSEELNEQQQLRNRTNAAREGDSVGQEEQARGISPLNPSSMPRAEDDEETYANSPEYHDRVPVDGSPKAEGEPKDASDRAQRGPAEESGYAPDGTTKSRDSAS